MLPEVDPSSRSCPTRKRRTGQGKRPPNCTRAEREQSAFDASRAGKSARTKKSSSTGSEDARVGTPLSGQQRRNCPRRGRPFLLGTTSIVDRLPCLLLLRPRTAAHFSQDHATSEDVLAMPVLTRSARAIGRRLLISRASPGLACAAPRAVRKRATGRGSVTSSLMTAS